MTRSSRNQRLLLMSNGIALAGLVFAANAAAANGSSAAPRAPLGPETIFDTGDVPTSPLLSVFNAPHRSSFDATNGMLLGGSTLQNAGAQSSAMVAWAEGVEGSEGSSALSLRASEFEIAPSPTEQLAVPPPLRAPEVEMAPSPAEKPAAAPPIPGLSESPPPDPVPAAIAAALTHLIVHDGSINPLGGDDWRGARAAIGAFYADRRFSPVWVDEMGLTAAGRAVMSQLERAPEDGLSLSSIALPRHLEPRLSPNDLAQAETAIAEAVVTYAEQASGSRVPPWRVSRLVSAATAVADPGVALAETASAPDPGQRLADFNPPQRGYRALRDELGRMEDAEWRRDRREGGAALDLGTDALAYPPLVDSDVHEAPKLETPRGRFKGLARNAVYTASVDRTLARRRAAILANMEMWRWEPREMGERRIEVNVPDFTVTMIEGDAVVHSARVVVGKPATPTPIFSNVMRYVLINPAWQVPDSIIQKEMLPKLAADPKYFKRRGYEVKTVGGRLVVRQPPGEDNALGRIAFMFPNDHSVYLHDTPLQALFDADMRAFSHGCVRVEDPLRLAELVLGWSEERITAAIGGPERTVFLPRPVPIHIEYFTEFVDESGELQERPDVYGLTQKVAGILSGLRQD